MLVVNEAADQIPQETQKCTGKCLRDDVERKDKLSVLELLANYSREEQVLVPKRCSSGKVEHFEAWKAKVRG